MALDASLPPHAWRVVVLLWFTVLSNYLARALFTTMHGSLVAAIPMSEAQFGLLTSALLWTYGLASPFAGFLADRFQRSRVIIVSMILWSLTTWLASYCRTFQQLVILRAVMGLMEACYMPAALALICDYHQGATRSMAIAIHHTGFVVGLGLSGLGGWLAEQQSWHFAFALVGLTGVAYSVPLALLLRDAPRGHGVTLAAVAMQSPARLGEAVLAVLGLGAFLLMLSVHAMLNLVDWAVIGWVPLYMQQHFHVSQGVAGISATGYKNAALIVGLFIGGVWADRWSRSNARVLDLAILGLGIFYLFLAFYDPNTMPVLCEVVDARYRATAYGLLNCVGMISAGLGVFVFGVMLDRKLDLHLIFESAALLCLVCALIYRSLKPTPRSVAVPVGAVDLSL